MVERRTKRNLSIITKSVLQLHPKEVFTDLLQTYRGLIPKNNHNIHKKNSTITERHNLTLRSCLKGLSRKTICFSKLFEMLEATLKLYLYGRQLMYWDCLNILILNNPFSTFPVHSASLHNGKRASLQLSWTQH